MSNEKKLSHGQKHILLLVRKGAKENGWAPVSKFVAPIFYDGTAGMIPKELCDFESLVEGGRARLTDLGNNVLDAMEYL